MLNNDEEVALERIVRNPKELWIGIIYIAVGSVAVYLCQDLDMGRAGKMGPAYFPTLLSVLLIGIGVISLVRSFVKVGAPVGTFAIRGMALVTLAIVLFGVLVRGAGLAVPCLCWCWSAPAPASSSGGKAQYSWPSVSPPSAFWYS